MGWVWKQDQAWRGAYRDEAGKQHTKSFKRQIDAKRWVATQEAKVVRGDWIDPNAGKVTFAAFYAELVTSPGLVVFDAGGTRTSPSPE